MSNEPIITPSDQEALSAYLDGMLSQSERAELEARLQNEPQLRQELNTLRQTVRLVQELPALKAPRNFTLTVDMLEQSNEEKLSLIRHVRSIPRNVVQMPTLSLVSAAASVALVMLGFILIYGYQQDSEPVFTEIVSTFGLDSNTMPDDTIENRTADSDAVAMAPSPTAMTMNQTSEVESFDEGTTLDMARSGEEQGLVQSTAEANMPYAIQATPQPTQTASRVATDTAAESFAADVIQTQAAQIQEEELAAADPQLTEVAQAPAPAQQDADAFAEESDQAESLADLANDGAAANERPESESADDEAPAVSGEIERQASDESLKTPEADDQTDLTLIGIILIVAGVLLAMMTFLINRLRNS